MDSKEHSIWIQHLIGHLQRCPPSAVADPLAFWLKRPEKINFDALANNPLGQQPSPAGCVSSARADIPPESKHSTAKQLLFRSNPWAFRAATYLQHALVNRRWVIRNHCWRIGSPDPCQLDPDRNDWYDQVHKPFLTIKK